MLLELGSGNRPYNDGRDWIHNDERNLPDIELVGSIPKVLNNLETSSVEEVLARHILEHFSYNSAAENNIYDVLKEIKRILKPNGSLTIEVPNLEGQIKAWLNGDFDAKTLIYYIFGEQDYNGNFHYNGFTKETLASTLNSVGFEAINIADVGLVLVCSCRKAR